MIEPIAIGLLSIFTIYYVYFITRVRMGLLSLQHARSSNNLPLVTVIVAARNEEKCIDRCLQSLIHQTYPTIKYEIIIVDDGSTDITASIVLQFSKLYTNVHLLSLPIGPEPSIGCKPLAIAKGIAQAAGEIILSTDADCIAPPRWIEIMVNHFEENVAFIAGPIIEQPSKHFISKLAQLEFLGLITTAAGLIGSGRPIICNGANMAYRKSAFITVGGFGDNGSFNDDESLMNRIVFRNIGKIVFAPESEAVITTRSSNTTTSFLLQRIRWVNKRGRYEDKSILFTLVSLYLFFLIFALVVLFIPLKPQLLFPAIIVIGIKAIVDFYTLRAGARLFLQRVQIFHFVIAELLHVPYIVIASAIGQLGSIQWKGRKIRK